MVQRGAAWCSVVQRGAAWCLAARGGVLQCTAVFNHILKRIVIEGGAYEERLVVRVMRGFIHAPPSPTFLTLFVCAGVRVCVYACACAYVCSYACVLLYVFRYA